VVRDNYNLKSHKYVSITTKQQDTEFNPKPNPNPNPTTEQHAIVHIQQNIVACIKINSYETCYCTVRTTLGCNFHTATAGVNLFLGPPWIVICCPVSGNDKQGHFTVRRCSSRQSWHARRHVRLGQRVLNSVPRRHTIAHIT